LGNRREPESPKHSNHQTNTMTRIAKKARSVKRRSKAKPFQKPLRYTIRKDSLDRRYAIDKRTGQRVSLQKAQRERVKRQKTAQPIPRYKPAKPAKPVRKKRKTLAIPVTKQLANKTRKAAAKKGWETRKANAKARSKAAKKGWEKRRQTAFRPVTARERIIELTGIDPATYNIPPTARMIPLYEPLNERIDRYPKVKEAAKLAFDRIQRDWYDRRIPGWKPPADKVEHMKSNLREIIAERVVDYRSVDEVLESLWQELEGEFSMRGLYELYFSPKF